MVSDLEELARYIKARESIASVESPSQAYAELLIQILVQLTNSSVQVIDCSAGHSREKILESIDRMKNKKGTTVFLNSHLLDSSLRKEIEERAIPPSPSQFIKTFFLSPAPQGQTLPGHYPLKLAGADKADTRTLLTKCLGVNASQADVVVAAAEKMAANCSPDGGMSMVFDWISAAREWEPEGQLSWENLKSTLPEMPGDGGQSTEREAIFDRCFPEGDTHGRA